MSTIEVNKKAWDGDYNWANRGDEWSASWGSPAMQWYGTILPRILSDTPTGTILEIACGFGRWTEYLKDLCNHLVLVDLSQECIEACKVRFSQCSHIDYHVNDGKSLEFIPDASVDFVFSYDSLVHVDESVMGSYLGQLQRILKDDGTAFLHHSNLGEYQAKYTKIRSIPKLAGALTRLNMMNQNFHGRDFSVDAKKINKIAQDHNLTCIIQEIIPWADQGFFIDCMSTIVKNPSQPKDSKVWRNSGFLQEQQNLLKISQIYGSSEKL